MTSDEIIREMRKNKQEEFEMLLLLLFTGDGFAYSPIDRPHFDLFDKNQIDENIIIKSDYKADNYVYRVVDGNNYNIICSYGDNLTVFITENGEDIIKGRVFFNHPEHLYGYIVKMGNQYKYEIIYERSKEKGIKRIITSAFLEYIDYFGFHSYEDINAKIEEIYEEIEQYRQTVITGYHSNFVFNPNRDINNEAEFIFNDSILNRIREWNSAEAAEIKKILSLKLNDNLIELYNENNRFKMVSNNNKAQFLEDGLNSSWVYQVEYKTMPTIYTKLNERISIIDSRDEIPDIIQILVWKIKATKLNIATGYMFDSGIEMIASACSTVTRRKGNIELLIGSLQTYKPEVKQKMVNRNTADIINGLCKLPYYTIMTYPERFYHGKYYYLSNQEVTYIITGSSNVTSTAYKTNRELDVIFRFDRNDDPLLHEFEDWYSETKEKSKTITDLDIDLFESNLYKDDMGNKHGASYYRNLTSEEEKARYRLIESYNPTRVELNLFAKRRDFKAFANYIAFVFEEKQITILECFDYGNSSYIFSTSSEKELQEKLCRKSKDQVQRESFFITCVPHDELYEKTINSVIG